MSRSDIWETLKVLGRAILLIVAVVSFAYGLLKDNAYYLALGGIVLVSLRIDQLDREIKALREKK